MPALNLDAIRRRAEAATPGTWKTGDRYGNRTLGSSVAVISGSLPPIELDPRRNGRADAAFIAHARQDVPALLAEIDRLRSELDGRLSAEREAIEALERVGCQFFACEGPTLEPIDMVTCHVCALIAKLRAAQPAETLPRCQCSAFPMAGGAADCPNHVEGAVPV